MAPLSRELTGVILPHDFFGSHLDSSGKTVDTNLEKQNFKKAGEILAEIWSAVCIDGHEVVAKYIDPNDSTPSVPDLPDEEWYVKHVRESQYLLQVTMHGNFLPHSPYNVLYFLSYEFPQYLSFLCHDFTSRIFFQNLPILKYQREQYYFNSELKMMNFSS